jgi:hypothetical protein
MTQPHHILADKGDMIEVVLVLVILGISAIARKINQAKQQARAEREAQGLPSAGGFQQATPPAAPKSQPDARRGPQRVPPRPDEALARAFRRQMGMEQEELPLRSPPPIEPPQVEEDHSEYRSGAEGMGVEVEMRQQQRRLQMEDLRRRQRMSTKAPQEADTKGIEGRLLHVPKADQPHSLQQATPVSPSLELLRQAVIWHEILSPPKALQHRREPWST